MSQVLCFSTVLYTWRRLLLMNQTHMHTHTQRKMVFQLFFEGDQGHRYACRNDCQRRTAEEHLDAQCNSLRSSYRDLKSSFCYFYPYCRSFYLVEAKPLNRKDWNLSWEKIRTRENRPWLSNSLTRMSTFIKVFASAAWEMGNFVLFIYSLNFILTPIKVFKSFPRTRFWYFHQL